MDTRDEYQELFNIYWPVGVGVFLVISAAILFAVLRYRSDSDELPEGRDESKPAELGYAAVVAVVVAGLLFLTYSTMGDIDAASTGDTDAAPLEVSVTAARWNWRFEYPGEGIAEESANGEPATLVVPADTPVRFTLTSLDVQHSFYVPELRFKRDALPATETVFALEFADVGFHEQAGQCAEYCGLRHSYMDFNVDVKSPSDFENWLEQRRAADPELEPPVVPEGGET